MIDMYIDNSEPSENVGQIHFCVEYDFQNNTLILKILQVNKIDKNLFFMPKKNAHEPGKKHYHK